MDQDLVSFVVRFVREAGDDQQARWRGVIKHVQSNSDAAFSQFSEAMTFMQQYMSELTALPEAGSPTPGTPEALPFQELNRMWGDLMPRYTKMVLDSVGESSREMTRSMDRAVQTTRSAWGMPTTADAGADTAAEQSEVIEALRTMTQQMAALTQRMTALEDQISALAANAAEQAK